MADRSARLRTVLAMSLWVASGAGARSAPVDGYHETVVPFFKAHCVDCHLGDEPEGDFSITRREYQNTIRHFAGISDDFVEALARSLLTSALGRELSLADESALRQILKQAASNGHTLRALIRAIAQSEPFTTT